MTVADPSGVWDFQTVPESSPTQWEPRVRISLVNTPQGSLFGLLC